MDVVLLLNNWDASLSLQNKEDIKGKLAFYINDLLLHDFEKLVQILYRTDVSEKGLKKVLEENKDKDAGHLIAELLIKRQEEKIALRQSFPPAKDISEDERW